MLNWPLVFVVTMCLLCIVATSAPGSATFPSVTVPVITRVVLGLKLISTNSAVKDKSSFFITFNFKNDGVTAAFPYRYSKIFFILEDNLLELHSF